MAKINNIRYGEPGKISFDYEGETFSFAEPKDVLLVGCDGADEWITHHYGFMLRQFSGPNRT